ncbi:MAG: bifunctional rhamnulose-1-phosphate aldolase/short-chain dehydrogenase, partial [Acidimicrobiia bacterium]|nr:bifunctional rhamnulose-1-phosphate aldolase/short-chain dehydrogenase [Acidimicrobiia bacterium]
MTNREPAAPLWELIERSNRLGADRRNTNFGGGNTSAKGVVADPISGEDVTVMWVKGSGGDLATLTAQGVSMLRLDRVRALRDRYVDLSQEDELHQLLDHCAFGPPGAAPSIDTSMHALLPAAHVDHLHPDPVIALAASADGEALTREIFGEEIGWVPWQRPGFDLAIKIDNLREANASLRGVIMGGHGLSTWAETSDECERISLDVIRRAADFIEQRGTPEPLGPLRVGFGPLDEDERRMRAAALAPMIRGLAATDRPVIGRWFDDAAVLDFIGREATPRLAPLGTSCPDHFIRTKVRPLLLDLPTTATIEEQHSRLRRLHEEYREDYRRYYERYAGPETPPMRHADPAIFLIPGVGMFSFGADRPTAQVAGEFYLNAINVIRGAEAVSAYTPVSESEKFGVEYWLLEDLKLRRRPAPKPLTGKVAVVIGVGSGIEAAIVREYEAAGAVVVVAGEAAAGPAEAAVLQFGGVDIIIGSSPTDAVGPMIAQGTGGDVVLLGSTPAAVSEMAADLAEHRIRVNGIASDPTI